MDNLKWISVDQTVQCNRISCVLAIDHSRSSSNAIGRMATNGQRPYSLALRSAVSALIGKWLIHRGWSMENFNRWNNFFFFSDFIWVTGKRASGSYSVLVDSVCGRWSMSFSFRCIIWGQPMDLSIFEHVSIHCKKLKNYSANHDDGWFSVNRNI